MPMTMPEAKPREHLDRTLRCAHCGGAEFRMLEYAVRTTEDELLRLPWAADTLKAYICGQCGCIQWFGAVPGKDFESGVSAHKTGE
jgi:hypothetical protein